MHDDTDDDDDGDDVGTPRRGDCTEKVATHGAMLVRMSHITPVLLSNILLFLCVISIVEWLSETQKTLVLLFSSTILVLKEKNNVWMMSRNKGGGVTSCGLELLWHERRVSGLCAIQ